MSNRVTHTTRGPDELRKRLSGLPGTARTAVAATLDDVAVSAAADVQLRLGQSLGTGPHWHSALGAPPADPKGRLAAAVRADRAPDGTGTRVTVDLPFARDLEFGTAKLAPRPFLRPAMLRAGRNARARLGAALRGACSDLKGGSR